MLSHRRPLLDIWKFRTLPLFLFILQSWLSPSPKMNNTTNKRQERIQNYNIWSSFKIAQSQECNKKSNYLIWCYKEWSYRRYYKIENRNEKSPSSKRLFKAGWIYRRMNYRNWQPQCGCITNWQTTNKNF